MRRFSWAVGNLGSTVAVVATLACGGPERRAAEPTPTVAPTAAPITVPTLPPTTAPLPEPPPARTTPPPAGPGPSVTRKARVVAAPAEVEAAPAAVDNARVSNIVTDAESALGQGKLSEAAALFDDALVLDPDNARARHGKARAATTRLGLTRTLVPDLSSSEGAEGKLKKMDGFDDVEELDVKRAVHVPGRAELDSAAGHLKPGDTYKVSIYLRNLSKKKRKIKISNVNVHRIVNDKDCVVTVAWSPVEVPSKQRGLVATLTGTWEDDVSAWILRVRLLSESGDLYENQLVWK